MADLRYVSYGDSKCKFVFGKNEVTKDIDVDDRFIVNRDIVYRITNKVDYEYNGYTLSEDGIINCILLQVPRIPDDNVDDNLAYNDFSKKIDDIFVGNEICYIGEENEYMFNSQNEVLFSLESDTEDIHIIKQENNKCILYCKFDLNLIGKIVKLNVLDENNNIIGSKNILIKGV